MATFGCSTRAESDQRVHIYGTEGRISVGIPFNIPPDLPPRCSSRLAAIRQWLPRPKSWSRPQTTMPSRRRFRGRVLDGVPTPIPIEDAVANMRVLESIVTAGGR